jgi:RES domain-containing protein
MPIGIYRVCRRIHARLDGEGARRVGGRWNSPGRPMAYTAQSVGLAVLENLVHMSRQDYPTGYVIVAATIPDHVLVLDELVVRSSAGLGVLQPSALGDYWFDARLSAAFRVRSAVVPSDFNYLLNPRHLDFAQIAVQSPEPFLFDPRLFESAKQLAGVTLRASGPRRAVSSGTRRRAERLRSCARVRRSGSAPARARAT